MFALQGFFFGLMMVSPVGPVTVTLVSAGASGGRRVGARGALGVIVADAILITLALSGIATWLTDSSWGPAVEFVVAAIVIGVAIRLMTSRSEPAMIGLAVQRPVRALAAVNLINPLALISWVGLALLLPADTTTVGRIMVGGGALAASVVWHLGLGLGAGALQDRLTSQARLKLTQGAGGLMLLIGIALLVH